MTFATDRSNAVIPPVPICMYVMSFTFYIFKLIYIYVPSHNFLFSFERLCSVTRCVCCITCTIFYSHFLFNGISNIFKSFFLEVCMQYLCLIRVLFVAIHLCSRNKMNICDIILENSAYGARKGTGCERRCAICIRASAKKTFLAFCTIKTGYL